MRLDTGESSLLRREVSGATLYLRHSNQTETLRDVAPRVLAVERRWPGSSDAAVGILAEAGEGSPRITIQRQPRTVVDCVAGGEETRVGSFVQRWLGKQRPKQFCTFVGTLSCSGIR